jgi:citrate lyase subunit beta/citryl-CoA lyase
MTIDVAAARTFLFVPGNRPERFDRALAAGADMVIVDLEDAVAPHEKARARTEIGKWLDAMTPVALRINGADRTWFEPDLELCAHPGVAAIVLPKAELGAALSRVARLRPTLALIETAVGVQGLPAICATQGVMRVGIGAIDLLLDLDITGSEDVLQPILLQMVIASRAAGIAAPVAGITADFQDPDLVQAAASRARSLGFGGKLCIHPAQVSEVRTGFQPNAAEIQWARRIVEADVMSGGGAVALDGQMIDRPIVDRARRVLSQRD